MGRGHQQLQRRSSWARLIPLIPFLLLTGTSALVTSVVISLVALFGLGVGVSLLTKRSWLLSGFRQMALGGVAALVTFLVGQAIGASVA